MNRRIFGIFAFLLLASACATTPRASVQPQGTTTPPTVTVESVTPITPSTVPEVTAGPIELATIALPTTVASVTEEAIPTIRIPTVTPLPPPTAAPNIGPVALTIEQEAVVDQARAVIAGASQLALLYDAPLIGDQEWEASVLARAQELRTLLDNFPPLEAAGLDTNRVVVAEEVLSNYRGIADGATVEMLGDVERMWSEARYIYMLEDDMLRVVNAIATPTNLLVADSAPLFTSQAPFSTDQMKVLNMPEASINLTLSYNGQYMAASAGGDFFDASVPSKVFIWDTSQESLINTFDQPTFVSNLAFNPVREELAVGLGGGFGLGQSAPGVTVWDPRVSGSPLTELWAEQPISAMAYSPDGQLFAMASGEFPTTQGMMNGSGRLLLFNTQDFLEIARLIDGDSFSTAGMPGYISAVDFSADSNFLAVGTLESEVRLFDLTTQQELLRLPTPGWVDQVRVSDDGQTLVANINQCANSRYCDVDYNLVIIWSLRDGSERMRIKANDSMLEISANGEYLLAGDALWRLADSQPLFRFGEAPVLMHPTQALLAIGDTEGVTLWNIATNTAQTRLPCPSRSSMAVSPDGTMVAANCGPEIRLWEWE